MWSAVVDKNKNFPLLLFNFSIKIYQPITKNYLSHPCFLVKFIVHGNDLQFLKQRGFEDLPMMRVFRFSVPDLLQ